MIVSRGRDFYLVECNWKKDPVGAAVIRELHGKLSNRVGVHGVCVSMSGFTCGTVEQVAKFANQKIILLFGPIDVNSMVCEDSQFDALLTEKYRALVTRQKVSYK